MIAPDELGRVVAELDARANTELWQRMFGHLDGLPLTDNERVLVWLLAEARWWAIVRRAQRDRYLVLLNGALGIPYTDPHRRADWEPTAEEEHAAYLARWQEVFERLGIANDGGPTEGYAARRFIAGSAAPGFADGGPILPVDGVMPTARVDPHEPRMSREDLRRFAPDAAARLNEAARRDA